MKVLTGIYQADSGTISYRGQPVHFRKGTARLPGSGDQHHPPGAEMLPESVDCCQHLPGCEPRTCFGSIDHK